nr:hypothetical protein Iba_chr04cCG1650 [Ipomoea batatas]
MVKSTELRCVHVHPVVAVDLPVAARRTALPENRGLTGLLAGSTAALSEKLCLRRTGETPLLLAAAKSTPETEESPTMKTEEETQRWRTRWRRRIRRCFAQPLRLMTATYHCVWKRKKKEGDEG